MRESAHWVLNAAHVDRSLMRHKLSYDLFRALSAGDAKRFAAASRFVELNLNGKYHGAYLLMERVDRAMLELRSYDSNATSQACIYKAVDHGADFGQPGHAAYEQREPDPLVRPYWKPLDDFSRFVSAAPEAEFFHPETGIASRLDLDNAIDFHLLVLLASNMDGIDKNFIFARDALKTGAPRPRFFFVPWDYDATFGRNWNAVPVEPTAWLSNHLFDRLLKDAAYRKRFAARWKALRAREFSISNVHRLIDENARTLGDATNRNTARWRTLNGYPDRLSFAEDVAQMKNWIKARAQWLDQEIEQQSSR
jgi:spore coat protein H